MSKYLSIILYFCIFVGGVVVAVLSANDNPVVMWVGIIIAVFTLITGLLTTRDIDKLQQKAKHAVYLGETIGVVTDIDTSKLKEDRRLS